jgi:hypothetical protein
VKKTRVKSEPSQPDDGNNGRRDDEWPEPQALEDHLLPVLPMTKDMLPEPFATWTADIAYRLQCPHDFTVVTAVSMISSLLGTRVNVCARQFDKSYIISPHIWGALIGAPGSKKTPSMSAVLKLLRRLEADNAKGLEAEQADYKVKALNHADEVKAKRHALNKLRNRRENSAKARDGDDDREKELKAQLEELIRNEPRPPAKRWFYINDLTTAALQEALKANPTCILFWRDELVGMLTSWEMDGHQSDRSLFLEAWTGLEPYNGIRLSRGAFSSPICIVLFGGIQPIKLIYYLRNPKTNLAHDGMMQRFQAAVYPDLLRNLQPVDQCEDIDAKNSCYAIMETLAKADFQDFGAIYTEYGKVPYFHFDTESGAQTLFNEWELANQAKAEDKNEDHVLREHFSKFPKLVASLAAVFHVIELADTDSKSTYIHKRHVEKALKWATYLESDARRIYELAKTPSLAAAFCLAGKLTDAETKIDDWMKGGFTERDLSRKHWQGVDEPPLVKSALARLEECRWIRSQKVVHGSSGGRPTIYYQINPAIIARRTAKNEPKSGFGT